jgi:curli biogenesis system outer membrane secretion channel CsgG
MGLTAVGSGRGDGAVVVAVGAVRVVEVPADEVVDVIAVRDRVVPAAWAVGVARVVGTASVVRGARSGVRVGDLQLALVDVPVVRMVEVAVVGVVDVVAVLEGGVTAAGAVCVCVVVVLLVAHGRSFQ